MSYTVHAKRWSGGWELHIDGEGVTQSRTLATAERQVRDYLSSMNDLDMDDAAVDVKVDLGDLASDIAAVREASRTAAAAEQKAARTRRAAVRKLRAHGLSVSDSAYVLGVSRGRISQLTTVEKVGKETAKKAATKKAGVKKATAKKAGISKTSAKKTAAKAAARSRQHA